MPIRRLLLVIGALALIVPAPAAAALSLDPVGTFDAPTHVAAPPGDQHRLFVVERAGKIRLVKDGVVQADPFLDISTEVWAELEGGLLSVAFAPDYATSGRLYVAYTLENGAAANCAGTCPPLRIVEYTRSAGDPDLADMSARLVLEIPHPTNGNHYGGQLQFGPDGMLYVAVGDGGGGGDPDNDAENTSSLLGKLLRIDPRTDGTPAYEVPQGNPFVGTGAGEVWSYGLRNPYRFSFDRATGDLVIGDVGQNAREEVDFAPDGGRGDDYGWNTCEGSLTYPLGDPCVFPDSVAPVYDYAHVGAGCSGSVIGGYVVRDPTVEELAGRYLFGDFCDGWVQSMALTGPNAGAPVDALPNRGVSRLASFGEDACGRVYLVHLDGPVDRLVDDTPGDACAAPPPPPATGGSGGSRRPAPSTQDDPPVAGLTVQLSAGARQRVLRSRALRVKVRCDRRCSLRALGRLLLRRRKRLRQVKRTLPAGHTATLRIRLSRAQRRAIRRALRRRRRVRARVHVRIRDGAGRLTSRSRTLRIVG